MSIPWLKSIGLLNELYQEQARLALEEAWPFLTDAERLEIAHRVSASGLSAPERRWQYKSDVVLVPLIIGSGSFDEDYE